MAETLTELPNLEMLSQIFPKYPGIQAVYLFGSHATGQARAASDLAIVPRHERVREKRMDILTDLARCGFCDVDLIFLDTDDIVLKYEAVRQNHVIYQTEDFDRGALYSQIVRQYLDFVPYLNVQREAYKRRLGPSCIRREDEAQPVACVCIFPDRLARSHLDVQTMAFSVDGVPHAKHGGCAIFPPVQLSRRSTSLDFGQNAFCPILASCRSFQPPYMGAFQKSAPICGGQ
jgi:predicted nucleotidyltransferase